MNRTPTLEGMHAATASTTGWIETNAVHGPQCLFCGDPAGAPSHSTKAGTPRSSGCSGAGRMRPHGSTDQVMDLVSFTLELSDGRPLEVDVSGPDGATPLVVHHGTPGERSQYPPFADAAAAQGLRYVSYSRPGYGGSSRQPGRAVADRAADTAAILGYLGADRCYSVGASGGGPYALACAALLADRVLACATVAGVGPFGAQDLDFLAGMGREILRSSGRRWPARRGYRHTLGVKLRRLPRATGGR